MQQALEEITQGKLPEAEATGNRALSIARTFGPRDLGLADTWDVLGDVYHEWKRCPQARASYMRALTILQSQPMPNSLYISHVAASFISGLCECGDLKAAQTAFRTYEPELMRNPGDALNQSQVLTFKATLASRLKKLDQAESLLREDIALLGQLPEDQQLRIALDRANLAAALERAGHHGDSLTEAQAAIDFFEKNAPRNPSLVAALNNASCALLNLGRRAESERTFERALQAATDLYGEDNEVPARIMLNYAYLLRKDKQTRLAAAWQKRGSEVLRRSVLGETARVDVELLQAAMH